MGNSASGEVAAAAPAAGERMVLGSLVALGSAVAFSLNMVLARLAYDAGGNIHALNLTRALLFLACLAAFLRLAGRPMGLPRRAVVFSLALGILLCAEMYLLLGAILFIPVSLTILILYTYPLMLAGVTWMTGREPASPARFAALLCAFVGLGLALAAPAGALDGRGLGSPVSRR